MGGVGERGSKNVGFFVHAKGIKTAHAGRGAGVIKWQNSVHVVVE
jgi:hypothetical protein